MPPEILARVSLGSELVQRFVPQWFAPRLRRLARKGSQPHKADAANFGPVHLPPSNQATVSFPPARMPKTPTRRPCLHTPFFPPWKRGSSFSLGFLRA